MKKIALITGASSGLGAEFLRQLQRSRYIDEFWVVARRKERLDALQNISSLPVRSFALDITEPESITVLETALAKEHPVISYLVVAAGLGKIGRTVDIPVKENDQMIDLNCRAAVDVTTICFPYLTKGSRVIEICSIAGFQPLPAINVYAASKAFLLSYTKTLHHELRPRGIHVTAVCPYWITDTEFLAGARTAQKPFYRNTPLSSKAASVVSLALQDASLNLRVSTPGIVCTFERLIAKLVPDAILLPIMELVAKL